MPSFDIVSEIDLHDLTNAVDQARRVVDTRFDFKGIDAKFERDDKDVVIIADADFQVEQMLDILRGTLIKSKIDPKCIDPGAMEQSGKLTKQRITLRSGLEKELTKKIVKIIKEAKTKVQATIQGDQVRVTGKKRDDLQEVIALLREQNIDMPLQFVNFRD
jgi:uncharacterized protein YajQ (UPF0234 family)